MRSLEGFFLSDLPEMLKYFAPDIRQPVIFSFYCFIEIAGVGDEAYP